MRELVDLFKLASMEIKKWGSSDRDVLEEIPEGDQAKVVHMSTNGGLDQTAGVMTLDMRWSTMEDCLAFQMEQPSATAWIPRKVLSYFLRIFDPMGLVSPFLLQARKLFQNIWVKHRT